MRRARWRRARAWASAQRWWVLGGAAVATLVLGMVGFARHFHDAGQSRSVLDVLYMSLQLFVLESGSIEPPIRWDLNLARLAAPTVSAVATAGAVSAALSALREHGVLASRRRGHIVVCGLGRKGARWAAAYLEDHGGGVVAIDCDHDVVTARRRSLPGVGVVHGDATDPRVLRHAGVHRARALYAFTGSDGTNATIAMAARRLDRRVGQPLEVFVHVVDAELEQLLAPWLEATEGACAIRLVNVYESAAKALVDRHPPAGGVGAGAVVVVGAGDLGTSTVVELGRRAAAAGRGVRVVVIDRDATGRVGGLRGRFPSLGATWRLCPHDMDITDPTFEAPGFLAGVVGGEPIGAVYVCVGDEELAVVTALTVARDQGATGDRFPIVVRVGGLEAGLGRLFADDVPRSAPYDVISAFDVHGATCRPGVLDAVGHSTVG